MPITASLLLRAVLTIAMLPAVLLGQERTTKLEWGVDRGLMAGVIGNDGGGTFGGPITLRYRQILGDNARGSVEVRMMLRDRRPGLDPTEWGAAAAIANIIEAKNTGRYLPHLRPYVSFGPLLSSGRATESSESTMLWGAMAGYGIKIPWGTSAIRLEAATQYEFARGKPDGGDYFPSRLRGGLLVGLSGFR
jgi:hypothetical protein